ncbi:MAG: hypothetical protein AB7L71_00060 [Vicinamibacterales bacterium]
MSDGLGYKRRQRVPDPAVLNAADQYEEAAEVLWDVPPELGISLPFMNCTMIAIELYLKSLASALEFRRAEGEFGELGLSTVHSRPDAKKHDFDTLLKAMPEHVRKDLLAAFAAWPENEAKPFLEWCAPYNRLFMDSRYPFEHGARMSGLTFDRLRAFLTFLKNFVHHYPIQEWVDVEHAGQTFRVVAPLGDKPQT